MIRHGRVETTDEAGCEWSMTYEFDGDLSPIKFEQMGCQTHEVPEVIESKLVDLAYDDEREKANGHEPYRD